MQAFRQQVTCVARRTRPTGLRTKRSYASDSHGHHDDHHHHGAHNVTENFGVGFYATVAAIPAAMIVYSAAQPSKDGEPSSFTRMLNGYTHLNEDWERINAARTKIIEQAAHDKHLLYSAEGNRHVDLNYPEVFQHGSPINVPAGHYMNLDKVVAHYRKQHIEDEERKVKKLEAAAREE